MSVQALIVEEVGCMKHSQSLHLTEKLRANGNSERYKRLSSGYLYEKEKTRVVLAWQQTTLKYSLFAITMKYGRPTSIKFQEKYLYSDWCSPPGRILNDFGNEAMKNIRIREEQRVKVGGEIRMER